MGIFLIFSPAAPAAPPQAARGALLPQSAGSGSFSKSRFAFLTILKAGNREKAPSQKPRQKQAHLSENYFFYRLILSFTFFFNILKCQKVTKEK